MESTGPLEAGGKEPETEISECSSRTARKDLRLETVLGLRNLSIVLSYLEECEATSLLLTRKSYWTDTILPLLRIAPANNDNNSQKPKKHRHRTCGRHNAPLIKIPDASTRLERLNTRRWNKRYQRQRKEYFKNNIDCQNVSYEGVAPNRPLHVLAKDEWVETLTAESIEIDNNNNNNNHRRSNIMNPPLLQFYNEPNRSQDRPERFAPGTTCLASYPRSGNTLLRSLLETVTGYVTSSDTRPDRNLSIALAEKPPYFVGEGLAPPPCNSPAAFLTPQSDGLRLPAPPICKTHWPERIGCHTYDCHRVILLVRNPFDATDSYWHMNLTNTHTEKVKPSVTEEHRQFYESLVRHEILQVWISFLDYYWKECSKHKVPLLLVRYEDLVLNPRKELQRILEFSCTTPEQTQQQRNWWKYRLEEVTRDASAGMQKRKTDNYGYKSSSSATEDFTKEDHTTINKPITSQTNQPNSSDKSSHPSIGRSLRRGMFPESMLRAIHEFDDQPKRPREHEFGGNWLESLGYHVYKQGFPNNLDNLPPVPILDTSDTRCGSLTINVQDVSLELRPRDSPYGRKMRTWRRQRTANDTEPFPTI